MPTSAAIAEIAELDTQILDLELKLADLRRRRNALQPLSKLPPEIIGRILRQLVDDTIANDQISLNYPAWIPTTQFFSRWRSAALGCSELWTDVRCTNLGWFKAFLERSKTQLLHVDTGKGRDKSRQYKNGDEGNSTHNSEYDEMFRLIAVNMYRIQTLYLRANLAGTRIIWLRNIPAPHLDTLQVSGSSDHFPTPSDLVTPNILPKLRQIQLESTTKRTWEYLLPSHLLTVIDINFDGFEMRINDLFRLLSRCPSIHCLSIRYGKANLEALVGTSPIVLSQLQSLKLFYPPWDALDFLAFPSISCVDIQTSIYNDYSEGILDLCVLMLRRMLEPFNNPKRMGARIDHLSLVYSSKMAELRLLARDSANVVLASFSLDHTIESNRHSDYLDRLIQLARSMNLNFRSIYLGAWSGSGLLNQNLFYQFRHQSHITTISIGHVYAFLGLLTFFNPSCEDGTEQEQQKAICFCKECDSMRFGSFVGLKTLALGSAERMIGDEKYLGLFLIWLSGRRKVGLGLETLILRFGSTDVEEEDLNRIREVVTDVIVETIQ
ncbi:hypothetical protein AX16_006318 [Volvariella volvacea WC 439]|nr:hypothetical protein AX16_006318 [Volvariella volvacea WC 439]